MEDAQTLMIRFGVSLGIGLLIGIERERHRQSGARGAAGIRTMTLIAMLGAIGGLFSIDAGEAEGAAMVAVCGLAVVGFALAHYRRRIESREDQAGADAPDMTTEVAMLVTFALGMLSMRQPGIAAAMGVVAAILLVAKDRLRAFATGTLTEGELGDALILLSATLIVLPLLPDTPIDPFGAFVPRSIWIIVLAVMFIEALGHIAKRALGAKHGLPLAGFTSGFVSSLATVGAMGAESKKNPENALAAASGATFSTLATVVVLVFVVMIADADVAVALVPPLGAMGAATLTFCLVLARRATQSSPSLNVDESRAFDPRHAIGFAVAVGAMLFLATIAAQRFGPDAVLVLSALTGLADAHSTSYSVASLAASGDLSVQTASLGVLIAFSTNAVLKIAAAGMAGSRRFFAWVALGVGLSLAAAWTGAIASGVIAGL